MFVWPVFHLWSVIVYYYYYMFFTLIGKPCEEKTRCLWSMPMFVPFRFNFFLVYRWVLGFCKWVRLQISQLERSQGGGRGGVWKAGGGENGSVSWSVGGVSPFSPFQYTKCQCFRYFLIYFYVHGPPDVPLVDDVCVSFLLHCILSSFFSLPCFLINEAL